MKDYEIAIDEKEIDIYTTIVLLEKGVAKYNETSPYALTNPQLYLNEMKSAHNNLLQRSSEFVELDNYIGQVNFDNLPEIVKTTLRHKLESLENEIAILERFIIKRIEWINTYL